MTDRTEDFSCPRCRKYLFSAHTYTMGKEELKALNEQAARICGCNRHAMSNSTPRAALPPLPERAGYAPSLKSDIYTAEQVEQIRRETVQACAAIAEETVVAEFEGVYHYGENAAAAILALLPVKGPKE